MQEIDFIVIKRSYSYSTCHVCNGSGKLERHFRQMNYLYDCSKCNGTGRIKHAISEEYNLQDAINELK
jgi:DnaJ-class molecular chaperone